LDRWNRIEQEKRVRICALEAFKNQLDEKLKDKKKKQEERERIKQDRLILKQKESLIKKESVVKMRLAVKKEKASLEKKLAQQKKSEWVKTQKEKEKVYVSKLKLRLKGGRRVKDPKSPVRPRNAFVWYYGKNFGAIHAELKQALWAGGKSGVASLDLVKVPISLVMKEARSRFQKLGKDEETTYATLAHEDLNRYQEERKKYLTMKKSHSAHRVLTPYIRFFTEVRPLVVKENPSAKATDIAKLIGQKWGKITGAEKDKYIKAYDREKNEQIERDESE